MLPSATPLVDDFIQVTLQIIAALDQRDWLAAGQAFNEREPIINALRLSPPANLAPIHASEAELAARMHTLEAENVSLNQVFLAIQSARQHLSAYQLSEPLSVSLEQHDA
jgi:hypothetical protein